MSDASIEVSLENRGVLSIVLAAPKANILTLKMMGEIRAALAAHRSDKELKLVVLRGAGGNFSFGAAIAEHKRDVAPGMLREFHQLVRELVEYPVPLAALVEGKCLGGAFELVLTCQFVFVTESAAFACPEIKLGVFPPVLAALGHSRLGPVAEQLLLTGGELSARRAHEIGFATAVLAPGTDAWAQMIEWYGKTLAPLSAHALREGAHAARLGAGLFCAIREPLEQAEKQYLERILPSFDGNEGIDAFLTKRAPMWKNE